MVDEEDAIKSELGKKEYWDEWYARQEEYMEVNGDDTWFGPGVGRRLIDYIIGAAPRTRPVLDLGCGNGAILRALQTKGFERLYGVDYCQSAIEVARRKSIDGHQRRDIVYKVVDVMGQQGVEEDLRHRFHLIYDLGSWDAISLSSNQETPRNLISKYLHFVADCFHPVSKEEEEEEEERLLVIVSCNFTDTELTELVSTGDDRFSLHCRIQGGSQISFGGRSGGCTTVTLVFSFRSSQPL